MPKTKIVKLFKNGASQAVRLPAEFRFDGNTVFATQNETTGDVLLSTRPGAAFWEDMFERFRRANVPEEFMADRPLNQIEEDKNIFGEDE